MIGLANIKGDAEDDDDDHDSDDDCDDEIERYVTNGLLFKKRSYYSLPTVFVKPFHQND